MEGLMYDCLFWDDAVECHGEGCCQIEHKQSFAGRSYAEQKKEYSGEMQNNLKVLSALRSFSYHLYTKSLCEHF